MQNWQEDAEVRAALDWFVQLMGANQWRIRCQKIERRIETVWRTRPVEVGSVSPEEWTSILSTSQLPTDTMAWYLYLARTYLQEPQNYEHAQGARVIPVFKAIGKQLDDLRSIAGLEPKVARMIRFDPEHPDGLLFEILVGAAYRREEWSVEFLEESHVKSPDFRAIKGPSSITVECKRKARVSDYARDERVNWIRLYAPVRTHLTRRGESLVLDIVFHQELSTFSDDFLANVVVPKLDLMVPPAVIVDNEDLTVEVRFANVERCEAHLKSNYVKMTSAVLNQLLFDFDAPDRGITTMGRYKTAETGRMKFVSEVDWAAAAIWSCDAPGAIEKKTRSLHRQLIEAASQLGSEAGAIHVGVEVYDGELIQFARYASILDTMDRTTLPPNVKCIYHHLIGFEAPPDENWAVEETCHYFLAGDERLMLKSGRLLTHQAETIGT